MKKTLVSTLTTALVVGVAGTTFAASNPFSDVPADHWSYDAVTQLAQDGVIDGFGDGTYRGDKNITRYEMAQMVAKAMAKSDVSAKDKAMIDKLAAEFSDELNSLGVRVANLEKHADMVKWTGVLRNTYKNTAVDYKGSTGRTEEFATVFRIEPQATVNDHWKVNARLEGQVNLINDEFSRNGGIAVKRAWAQGNYDGFEIKVGKIQFKPKNENGLVWDQDVSGAQVSFGKNFKTTLFASRIAKGDVRPGYQTSYDSTRDKVEGIDKVNTDKNDPASVYGIQLMYDNGEAHNLYGNAAYYRVNDKDFRAQSDLSHGVDHLYSNNDNEDNANIWVLGAGYRFSKKANFYVNYATNRNADYENRSWQTQLNYGTYSDGAKKGAWGVYAGYRYFGHNTSLAPNNGDDVFRGAKGFVLGANYAPADKVGIQLKYFNGKTITTDEKASRFFGRIDFFF